jgi:hypothetical protein
MYAQKLAGIEEFFLSVSIFFSISEREINNPPGICGALALSKLYQKWYISSRIGVFSHKMLILLIKIVNN